MTARVVCPCCGQDWLRRIRFVALNRLAIHCLECEAVWFKEADVGPCTGAGYEVAWFDYTTFMEKAGRPPYDPEECVVIGYLEGAETP